MFLEPGLLVYMVQIYVCLIYPCWIIPLVTYLHSYTCVEYMPQYLLFADASILYRNEPLHLSGVHLCDAMKYHS